MRKKVISFNNVKLRTDAYISNKTHLQMATIMKTVVFYEGADFLWALYDSLSGNDYVYLLGTLKVPTIATQ